MSKSVTIPSSPRNKPTSDHLRALDDLVHRDEASQSADRKAPKPPMKRLTFDAALHKRIRLTCLERGKDMAAELRRILVENFPP